MNIKQLLLFTPAIAFVAVSGLQSHAQTLEPVPSAKPLVKIAAEQSLETQTHLLAPLQRIHQQRELGLYSDDSYLPGLRSAFPGLITAFYLNQPQDERPRNDRDRKPQAEEKELHQVIRDLESKIESADSDRGRAELVEKLNMVREKLEVLRHDREREVHNDHGQRQEHGEGRRDDGRRDEGPPHDRDGHGHGHPDHNPPHHAEVSKIRALHEAAERLEHGGLHDMARELHRQAEDIERALHHGPGEGSERILMEVMKNMDQLRGEVREINERLEQITQRLDRMKIARPDEPSKPRVKLIERDSN